jgi:AcrR family transcriptional regulator
LALYILIDMPKVVPEYKEEAKERIVQAALRVFSEKGYHEATMEDVAQKLGVSKGALYLYFRSKDELLRVIIDRWNRSMRSILPSSGEGRQAEKSLKSMFDHIAEDPIGRIGLGFDLISEASRNPAVRKILSEAYERNLKTVSEFFRRQNIKNLKQNASNVKYQSQSLVALQFGLMVSLILGIDKGDAQRAWEQMTKALTHR